MNNGASLPRLSLIVADRASQGDIWTTDWRMRRLSQAAYSVASVEGKTTMAGANLIRRGIGALAAEMQAGRLSSEGLVRTCLTEIRQKDHRLHAFVEVYEAEAIASALSLDAERSAGKARGPLHGVPVAVKDLADIEGRITGFGSRSYSDTPAESTAPFIRALETAGAIILGKTHSVEFAFGSWGTNHALGTPVNPAVPGHASPGGSSSGSGVAVAAGMVPAAIGSDTGGSVRIPAGLCGVAGMKPSHGRISLEGVAPLSPRFDTIGPLANRVDDLLVLYEAMSSLRRADTSDLPGTTFRRLDPAVLAPADPGIVELYERALADLSAAGARIVLLDLPCELAEYQSRCGSIMAYDAYSCLKPIVDDFRPPLDPFVRRRILAGRHIPAAAHAEALELRRQDQAAFSGCFGPTDILVLPTTPLLARQVESIDEAQLPMSRYTRLANYLDLCAVSVPFGNVSGAPAGMQFVANKGQDFDVLSLAIAFAERVGVA
jgi:aspartyl-tRNA(Asn)/glutamyl-tRNA(Gln) amidotransferase subunit A